MAVKTIKEMYGTASSAQQDAKVREMLPNIRNSKQEFEAKLGLEREHAYNKYKGHYSSLSTWAHMPDNYGTRLMRGMVPDSKKEANEFKSSAPPVNNKGK
jgi:hypothetical protein